jgi:hypothetical protein
MNKNSWAYRIICLVLILATLAMGAFNFYYMHKPQPQLYGVTSGSLVPSVNNTQDIGTEKWRFHNGWFSSNLTAANVTATTLFVTTISGVETGSANITAGNGAVVVSHSLGSTPVRIFLTLEGNPGIADSIYWGSVNSTAFTIFATTNFTNNTAIGYRAMLANNK